MNNPRLTFAAIILAAGAGKRMNSKIPKVLHQIAGQPMILRSYKNLKSLNPKQVVIVASPDSIKPIKEIVDDHANFAIQQKPQGTADAAQVGLRFIKKDIDSVIIANGDDSAFYKPATLKKILKKFKETDSVLTLTTINVADAQGLGRVIRSRGKIYDVVEQKEANASQRKIKEVNAGFYVFDKNWLQKNLPKVTSAKQKGEKYLISLVKIAAYNNQRISVFNLKDKNQWHGINTRQHLEEANLKLQKRIHIMGVSGSGASAIAGIAAGYGWDVSGCDLNPNSSYTKNLSLKIIKGHDKSHTHNIGALVISPAILKYHPKNPEIGQAKQENTPVYTWQEFQGRFLEKNKFVISVSGAYGKSTTTAMISKILTDSGLDPTCEIGASVLEWGRNFRVGKSKYYINEADEYNDNFLNYQPDIAVVLNIAWDHPDYFKNEKSVFNSYVKFIQNIKRNGYLVIDNTYQLKKLADKARSDIKIVKIAKNDRLKLSIIGDFRKDNANAAVTTAEIIGIKRNSVIKSLEKFKGLGRRLEYKGMYKGIKIFDDYAVQPYTVKTTANALKKLFENKHVTLVFEPHTFSRLNIFYDDFVKNLKTTLVDKILVTDVYASREHILNNKLAPKLASAIGPKAIYTGSINQTAKFINDRPSSFEIICSMGAGNVSRLYELIKKSN